MKTRKFIDGACLSYIREGMQFLAMPDGTRIPALEYSTISDNVNENANAYAVIFLGMENKREKERCFFENGKVYMPDGREVPLQYGSHCYDTGDKIWKCVFNIPVNLVSFNDFTEKICK